MDKKPARVLWFGTGSMTKALLPCVRRDNVHILAFIDERMFLHGTLFSGAPVIDLKDIKTYDYEHILVGARPYSDIAGKLLCAGVPGDKIVSLDFESYVLDTSLQRSESSFNNSMDDFDARYAFNCYIDREKLKKTPWYSIVLQNFLLGINKNFVTIKAIASGGYGDNIVYFSFLKELYKNIDVQTHIDVFTHYADMFRGHPYVRNVYANEPLHINYDITLRMDHFITLLDCRISLNEEKYTSLRAILSNFLAFSDRYKKYNHARANDGHDGAWAKLCAILGWNRWDALGASGAIPFSRNSRGFIPIHAGALDTLKRHGLEKSSYITIHAGAAERVMSDYMPKVWPREHWREFCRIFKQYHPDILLVQVGGDHSPVIEGTDLCLLGATSMAETKAILKYALLHIDGEGGLVHLRRQLGGKSVVLFGPTLEAYYGYEQNVNIVADKCGECMWLTDDWMERCIRGMDIPECMQSIEPQRVLSAVEEILAERKEYEYTISDVSLYSSAGRGAYESVVEDICRTCGVEKQPITETINGPCDTYIHGSKQWEYPYVLGILHAIDEQALKIADVGSGRGMLSWYLARQGYDVTAYDLSFCHAAGGDVDLNRRYIQFAKAEGFCAEFGDMFNLPADDDTFDVVTCISVVEHVPHKYYALKEMLRILRPGGKLILTYDLTEDSSHMEDAERVEIFTPQHIISLLSEFGVTVNQVHTESSLQRSIRDIQADKLSLPDGLTVGGLVLKKIWKEQ